jgi:hypothetical protein
MEREMNLDCGSYILSPKLLPKRGKTKRVPHLHLSMKFQPRTQIVQIALITFARKVNRPNCK